LRRKLVVWRIGQKKAKRGKTHPVFDGAGWFAKASPELWRVVRWTPATGRELGLARRVVRREAKVEELEEERRR